MSQTEYRLPHCGHDHSKFVVTHRKHNHSAFNGYHYTRSDYSTVMCTVDGTPYRTKAKWVDSAPDFKKGDDPNQPNYEGCKS